MHCVFHRDGRNGTTSCMYNVQFCRRPLTAAEFIAPLSKIDPIYKEEEEVYKVET